MTARHNYPSQQQAQQQQQRQKPQRRTSAPGLGSSGTSAFVNASGLYPVVQDLSDIEYNNGCCCGETFGNFQLADLVLPIAGPSSSIWGSSSSHVVSSKEQSQQQKPPRVLPTEQQQQSLLDEDQHSEGQQPVEEDTSEQREAPQPPPQLPQHTHALSSSSDPLCSTQSLHQRQQREEARHPRHHSVHHTRSGACLYETTPPITEHKRRHSDTPSFYEEESVTSSQDKQEDQSSSDTNSKKKKNSSTRPKSPSSGRKLHLRRKSRQFMNKLRVVARNPTNANVNKDISSTEALTEEDTTAAVDAGFVFGGDRKKFLEQYVLTRQIFKCQHSNIWECLDRDSGTRYCVKIFDRPYYSQRHYRESLDEDNAIQLELDMLTLLTKKYEGHPSLIQLVDILTEDTKIYVVMEWIAGGNLASTMVREGPMQEQQAQDWIRSLLQGVQYMHSKHVVHTNLQPENMLLAGDRQVKIADFGSAVDLEMNEPYGSTGTNVVFTAPEVLLGAEPYDIQADMWSVGCVAYYMLTGVSPFDEATKRRAIHRIIRAEYTFPAELSRTAKQFISSLLHVDRTVRLSADEALEHPWLRRAEKIEGEDIVSNLEQQQRPSGLFGGLLSGGSGHSRSGSISHHKRQNSLDTAAGMISHLSSAASTSSSSHPLLQQHRRHKSLSPVPPSGRKSPKGGKHHRRKSSLSSLSKGLSKLSVSKLFNCTDDSAKDEDNELPTDFQINQSSSTLSYDDSMSGGGSVIRSFANGSMKTPKKSRHHRQLTR